MLSGTTKLRLRTIVAPHGGCAETCEQFMRKTLSRLHRQTFRAGGDHAPITCDIINCQRLRSHHPGDAADHDHGRRERYPCLAQPCRHCQRYGTDHGRCAKLGSCSGTGADHCIEHSRKDGFDPENYGLAALRSELEQSLAIWGSPHPRQLSVLAQTAALALANDYRRRGGGQTANVAGLHAALLRGSLSQWITAGARQTKQFF